MILVFAGQKGGVGKSTHCTNLAVIRAKKGKRVIILDLDDGQGSALKWSMRRNRAKIEPTIPVESVGIQEVLDRIRECVKEYDDVLIDTGGADSTGLRLSIQLADLVITPIRSAAVEVETLDLIDRRLNEAKKGNPDVAAWILINDLTTHHLVREKAKVKVQKYCAVLQNMQLMHTTIDHRQAIIDANDAGAGVTEMELTKSVRAAIEDEIALEKEIWND